LPGNPDITKYLKLPGTVDLYANTIIDTDLLTRYLEGEATPEEAMAVDDWQMATPENGLFFSELVEAWEAAGTNLYQRPDLEARWEQFQQQIGMDNAAAQQRRLLVYKMLAPVVGIMVLFSVGLFFNSKEDTQFAISSYSVQTAANMGTTLLSDSTAIVLSPHTSLSYPQSFGAVVREIKLTGKAWFNVTAHPQQPFRIDLNDITLEVLGTSFEVQNTPADSIITVMVATGAVRLYDQQDTLTVRANQTGIYHKQQKRFEHLEGINNNALGYITRSFDFNNQTLQEIAGYLETAYQVKIRFEQPVTAGCRLSAAFDQQSLPYILDIIAATLNLTYTITGNQVYISGNGCN
jgi:transmembrane sensor